MSSTEYTLGHFGKKSSRVLKPPGGGSSDIFGVGAASSENPENAASGTAAPGTAASGTAASGTAASGTAASGTAASGTAAPGTAASGTAASGTATPAAVSVMNPWQIPEAQTKDTSTQSRLFGTTSSPLFYRAGERVSTPQKSSSNVPVKQTPSSVSKPKYVYRNPITGEGYDNPSHIIEKENVGKSDTKDSDKEAEVNPEVPPAEVIQTSVRVRNPPGGKSSGIW